LTTYPLTSNGKDREEEAGAVIDAIHSQFQVTYFVGWEMVLNIPNIIDYSHFFVGKHPLLLK